MLLTLSKRFEFSASARMRLDTLSERENELAFGFGRGGRYGQGYNFVLHTIFTGPVEPQTGMMLNVSDIKRKVTALLAARYDHKFLNVDTPPFDETPPTPENIARQLLLDIGPLFADQTAQPVACHLELSPESSATAYSTGRVERNFWIGFSAARRTISPHLSDDENRKLFGEASSPEGHGHNYRLRVTIAGTIDDRIGQIVRDYEVRSQLEGFRAALDHKNLNTQVPGLKNRPITTESLAQYAVLTLGQSLPLSRVKLYELPNFFAECTADHHCSLGLETYFHAAHRLHSRALSNDQNRNLYGKCNNPAGHGHQYRVETTLGGQIDSRTGTLYDLSSFIEGTQAATSLWDHKHLDYETESFVDRPSTGENIVAALWPKLQVKFGAHLERLRLWETPNNRFTLRRKG